MIGYIRLWNENGENVSLPIQYGWHVNHGVIMVDGHRVAHFGVYSQGYWGTEWGDEYAMWRFDPTPYEVG